ncbi:MAG: hypothetical protein IKE18_05905 [Oscillospiraceae bacterium]|nr:hypothetical protein [Oscillospiraceae bacterium]
MTRRVNQGRLQREAPPYGELKVLQFGIDRRPPPRCLMAGDAVIIIIEWPDTSGNKGGTTHIAPLTLH